MSSWLRHLISPRDESVIVGLGIALFIIAANTQTGWLYAVDSFLAALLGLGFVIPRLTLRGLEVSRSVAESAVEGDTVTVRLRVQNRGRMPRYLVTLEDTPAAAAGDDRKPQRFLIGCLAAGAGVTVTYPMRCARRGVWTLDPVALESATPLGLFPHRRKLAAPSEIVVHPRAEARHRLDGSAFAMFSSAYQQPYHRAGSSHDFLGIREYHPGDDTRFLHWPSSARIGQLMVREFHDTGARRLAILVENGPASAAETADGSLLDRAARMAAGLLRQARDESAAVTLVAGRGSAADVLNSPSPQQGLDWLARLRPDGPEGWCVVAGRALPELPPRCLLYVLAVTPEADATTLAALQARRIEVVAARVDPEPPPNGVHHAAGVAVP